MHNSDDKYTTGQGFEPGTSRLQAPVDTNEPSGPAILIFILDLFFTEIREYTKMKTSHII